VRATAYDGGFLMAPLVGLVTVLVLWTMCTLAVSCLAALGWALWPRRAGQVRDALREGGSRAFLLGLVNLLAYVIVIALLHGAGFGKLAGLVLFLWTVALTCSGLPGASALLGERLLVHAADVPPSTLRAVFAGTWVLGFTSMLPWLGWALLLAFLLTCFGGGLTAFLRSFSDV
jgi:hypothetical protein